MTKELSEHMEALRAIGPKLNKATDDAARVIAEVESFLNGLNLGVAGKSWPAFKEHSYKLDDDQTHGGDPRHRDFYHLAYGRGENGKFSIHIVVLTRAMELDPYSNSNPWDYTNDVGSAVIEWARATRGDRLKSFAGLPSLLADLAGNASAQIAAAEKAMEQVAESLKALGLDGPVGATPAGAKPAESPRPTRKAPGR